MRKKDRDILALVRKFKKWDERYCLIWWRTMHSELRMTPEDFCRTKQGYAKLRSYLLNTGKPIWSPLHAALKNDSLLIDGEGKPKELLNLTLPEAPIPFSTIGHEPSRDGRSIAQGVTTPVNPPTSEGA